METSYEEVSDPGDVSSSSQSGSSDSGVCNREGLETVEAGDGGEWVLEVPQFDVKEEEMGGERVVVVERDTAETDIEDSVEESMEDIMERFYLSEEEKEKMKPGQWERIFEEVEAAIASGIYDESEDDAMSVLSVEGFLADDEGDAE